MKGRTDTLKSIINSLVQDNEIKLEEITEEKRIAIIERLIKLKEEIQNRHKLIEDHELMKFEYEIERLLKYELLNDMNAKVN